MKKSLLFGSSLLFLLACSPKTGGPRASSQGLAPAEWDRLIAALVDNDWGQANRLAEQYLPRFADRDTSGEAARLRYMYIFSLAGRIGERSVGRAEGLKKVQRFVGQRIEMPSHPLRPASECVFNCFWRSEDDNTKIFTSSSNKDATFIHAFETFDFPKGLELEKNRGKTLRLGGTLAKIELRGQFLAAFGLEVKDCYYALE